jgi:cell division protein FtsW (lipid II flippase)
VTVAQVSAARRNTELSLLVLALIVGGTALALVAVAQDAGDAGSAMPFAIALVVCYAVTHVIVRRSSRAGDPLILPLAAALNAIGLAAIFRLAPEELAPAQVTWTVVGIACFIATLLLLPDYRVLARYKYVLGFTGLGLLLLPATPLGTEINGARLWIRIGGMSFQPGEIAKLCLVIFFAAYLAERKELLAIASRRVAGIHLPDIKHFGPLLVMWGVSLAVMFYEKDLGSSLLFFSIFLVMLYIATARLVYMAFGFLLFLAGAYIGYQVFAHVQVRVRVWLDAFNPDLIQNQSFQIVQSLFALATGGLFGTGWGQGRPGLIPEAPTDFIFSVIGEELGLLGTAAVLVSFLLLVARGLRIALHARNDFGQLLAAGLTVILGVQTFIILGGVTRLLPLTGITLPFMSYGGSSLLSNFILIGLLLRISHQSASEPDPAATGEILIGGRR